MKRNNSFYIYVIIVIVGMWLMMSLLNSGRTKDDYSVNDFYADVAEDTIEAVYIDQDVHVPTGSITVSYKDGTSEQFYTTDVSEIEAYAAKNDIQVVTDKVSSIGEILSSVLPYVCLVLMVVLMFSLFLRSGTQSRSPATAIRYCPYLVFSISAARASSSSLLIQPLPIAVSSRHPSILPLRWAARIAPAASYRLSALPASNQENSSPRGTTFSMP